MTICRPIGSFYVPQGLSHSGTYHTLKICRYTPMPQPPTATGYLKMHCEQVKCCGGVVMACVTSGDTKVCLDLPKNSAVSFQVVHKSCLDVCI